MAGRQWRVPEEGRTWAAVHLGGEPAYYPGFCHPPCIPRLLTYQTDRGDQKKRQTLHCGVSFSYFLYFVHAMVWWSFPGVRQWRQKGHGQGHPPGINSILVEDPGQGDRGTGGRGFICSFILYCLYYHEERRRHSGCHSCYPKHCPSTSEHHDIALYLPPHRC